MGYCIEQMESEFFISKKNKSLALEAIKALKEHEIIKDGKLFSWVDTNEFFNATSLKEAMEAWRWEIIEDKRGNVISIKFIGEKYGDDNILFEAIAKYIKSRSYIQFWGQDGRIWRWVFYRKNVKFQRLEWIDEPSIYW